MNRDDIIRMAREVGLEYRQNLDEIYSSFCDGVYMGDLERFATLVAEAEREACADICDQYSEIREINTAMGVAALNCADLIRARGDA